MVKLESGKKWKNWKKWQKGRQSPKGAKRLSTCDVFRDGPRSSLFKKACSQRIMNEFSVSH